ncbi:hypothetical protein C6P45_005307 [Maudiozyma exigua]|uniref:Thiamine pyrophosphokinase n=1 Tax=Maudiozyma exigua TaxID=34358 RepID=A0A9P6WG41_MAUEX|nr:hypothetical protein C6P45_005307 [Kazachstania exigua]
MSQCIENEERINIDGSSLNVNNKIDLFSDLFTKQSSHDTLLILNQRITLPFVLFQELWETKPIRICADGAANRLYEYLILNGEDNITKYVPDYIVGDLDSIKDDIVDFYLKMKVVILKQNTQYATDFKKCLLMIVYNAYHPGVLKEKRYEDNYKIDPVDGLIKLNDEIDDHKKIGIINVIAIGAIGGRFDQSINAITELYNNSGDKSKITLRFLTDTDIIMLIPGNGTMICYDSQFRDMVIGNCGLLPMGEPIKLIETHGLKWDVCNWDSSIPSGIVSSNNRFSGIDRCYIDSNCDFVMNIEYFPNELVKYMNLA